MAIIYEQSFVVILVVACCSRFWATIDTQTHKHTVAKRIIMATFMGGPLIQQEFDFNSLANDY